MVPWMALQVLVDLSLSEWCRLVGSDTVGYWFLLTCWCSSIIHWYRLLGSDIVGYWFFVTWWCSPIYHWYHLVVSDTVGYCFLLRLWFWSIWNWYRRILSDIGLYWQGCFCLSATDTFGYRLIPSDINLDLPHEHSSHGQYPPVSGSGICQVSARYPPVSASAPNDTGGYRRIPIFLCQIPTHFHASAA